MKDIFKVHMSKIIAGIIFILAYLPTMMWMQTRWFADDSYYSHGILVPFVSAFLIWQKKDELKRLRFKESPWGLRLIIAGAILFLIAAILRINFVSGFSMLIVFYGLVLFFYGSAVFKKIAFPLFFIVFMFPLPEVAITNISFRMKMFAAQWATYSLNKMGILAIREGSVIKMRTSQVVVEDVCSGLRSLISLTALGSIFAYWMKAPMWRRIALFLCTIPIAIITNMCRVVFLSFVSEVWGAQYTHGFVHDASGFMVFGIAFLLLYAAGKILE